MKSCFFIGHREANGYEALEAAVERHIVEYSVTRFIMGRYGNFDRMAAQAVRAAQERHPELRLQRTLLTPYPINSSSAYLFAEFDTVLFPQELESVPSKAAIPKANRYAIDHADYLIAYVCHGGNSQKFLDYARQRERRGLIHIENLAEI